jgi:hypothetical protein
MSSLFMSRRREDPSSCYFPSPNLMTILRGGVKVGKKKIGLICDWDTLFFLHSKNMSYTL